MLHWEIYPKASKSSYTSFQTIILTLDIAFPGLISQGFHKGGSPNRVFFFPELRPGSLKVSVAEYLGTDAERGGVRHSQSLNQYMPGSADAARPAAASGRSHTGPSEISRGLRIFTKFSVLRCKDTGLQYWYINQRRLLSQNLRSGTRF